jgi:hypothetical protein
MMLIGDPGLAGVDKRRSQAVPRPAKPAEAVSMSERSMDEDMQHLEAELHRIVAIARMLARSDDAASGEHWHEPYAYRACNAAEAAARNLRRQLESRWLVTPLSNERPMDCPPSEPSYPRVTRRGSRS